MIGFRGVTGVFLPRVVAATCLTDVLGAQLGLGDQFVGFIRSAIHIESQAAIFGFDLDSHQDGLLPCLALLEADGLQAAAQISDELGPAGPAFEEHAVPEEAREFTDQ